MSTPFWSLSFLLETHQTFTLWGCVVLIAFIARMFLFFRDLVGFIGALGTGPTTL